MQPTLQRLFPPPESSVLSPPTTARPLNKEDLEAFFDGVITLQLERSDVAGASVLVMKDGESLLLKGYGYSDLKTKRPVDPTSTIFRLASISKLFTWISAMQLVEQGKLDLDVDIQRYLDFPIKASNGISAPITLRNLMTHTGGFEETIRNIGVTEEQYYAGLREFLIDSQPHRLFEPGKVPAYSNYGVGLGSYIVQRVSGEPFEQYVAEHIFSPLGMTHSTFLQPPPENLQQLVSTGYVSSTLKPAIAFSYFSPVGAGGLSSSAADMGRFGQALLNGGELDGHRILKQESLLSMWTPQFQASPALAPVRLAAYFPAIQLERVAWYEHDNLIFVLLGISFAIICSVLIGVLLRLARRRLMRSSQPIPKSGTLALGALHRVAAVYWVVLLVGLAIVVAIFADFDFLGPTSRWDKYFMIGDILFAVAVLLSIFTVISADRLWRRPLTRRASQTKFTVVGSPACSCPGLSFIGMS